MNREIAFCNIAGFYGGDQQWLPRPLMRLGGCSTVCACHAAACLALHDPARGAIYPYQELAISKQQFVDFAVEMYRYVHPGWRGLPRLDLFCRCFEGWADRCRVPVSYRCLSADEPVEEAAALVKGTIDGGLPLQFLQLKHKDKELAEDLEWHWFTVTGYEDEGEFQLIFANEGQRCRVSLPRLWHSGYAEKGGLVVVE